MTKYVAIALRTVVIAALSACCGRADASTESAAESVKINSLREAYFGDLHLHTSYSFDAYMMFETKVDPDIAYRFAKGEAVDYLGETVRRRNALDFMAVTDHSEWLGIFNQLEDPRSAVSRSKIGARLKAFFASAAASRGRGSESATSDIARLLQNWPSGKDVLPANIKAGYASAWRREIELANRNYEPGRFTTFIAYEWTAQPGASVLHRNVIFRGDSAPIPFTALDSHRPEELWAWLDRIRAEGHEALAIPHNGNLSNGLMYDWVDSSGRPIDEAYAEERQANEPLSEIAQTKGQSESHPLLATNDEFADYEIMERVVGTPSYHPAGSYLRDALGRGLIVQRKFSANPYKYGFVGGSDLHSGLSVSHQADFRGGHAGTNLGGNKATPSQAVEILTEPGALRSESLARMHTSGNLTGVWAESNTRESIYNALRRKETFATSGTELKFRIFGGWKFDENLLQQKDWVAAAYSQGVPMGGDLPMKPEGAKSPSFAVWALKDPDGGNLDRIQIIKVWEEDGHQKEKVFDVVWAGYRKPSPKTGKLPAIGNTVDLSTGQYSNSIGAIELKAIWVDPEFRPNRFATYYLRVLEIPTPRWSTLLATQNRLPLPKDVPATEQQRGWSSPIWYTPTTR